MHCKFIFSLGLLFFLSSTVFGSDSSDEDNKEVEELNKPRKHHHHHHRHRSHHHHRHDRPRIKKKNLYRTTTDFPQEDIIDAAKNVTEVEEDPEFKAQYVTEVEEDPELKTVNINEDFSKQLIDTVKGVLKKLWDTLKRTEIEEFKQLFAGILKSVNEFFTSPSQGIKDLFKSIKKFWNDENAIYHFVLGKVNSFLNFFNLPDLQEIFGSIGKKIGLELKHVKGILGLIWNSLKHILIIKIIQGLTKPIWNSLRNNHKTILIILIPFLLFLFRFSILDFINNNLTKLLPSLGLSLLVSLLFWIIRAISSFLKLLLSGIIKLLVGSFGLLKVIIENLGKFVKFPFNLLVKIFKNILSIFRFKYPCKQNLCCTSGS